LTGSPGNGMETNLTLLLLVFGFVALWIGLSKGGLGGAAGSLVTPTLALVMPPEEVIGLVLPVLMLADLFAMAAHWRHWHWRYVLLLLPGALAGVTVGTLFITNAPTELLRLTLGIIVLLFGLYKVMERRILSQLAYQSRNWHGLLVGTVSGFSSALAHTGGPPVSIYLLMQEVKPRVFVATSVLFFFVLNWIKVPYYFYARLFDFQRLASLAWVLPLVPVGVWLGRWLTTRVEPRTFERVIVGFLLLSGLLLIFT
jgi:uncharacterized protein